MASYAVQLALFLADDPEPAHVAERSFATLGDALADGRAMLAELSGDDRPRVVETPVSPGHTGIFARCAHPSGGTMRARIVALN